MFIYKQIYYWLRQVIWQLLYVFAVNGDVQTRILRLYGLRLGNRCRILCSLKAFGSEPYLIRIGNHCEITSGVRLITHDGATWVLRERSDWRPEINRFGIIDIRDNCFIGINAIILPDITIGPNAIVAAGSVVTKDVPPDTIVAGNPACVIGSVETYHEKCLQEAVPGINYQGRNAREKLIEHFWGVKT